MPTSTQVPTISVTFGRDFSRYEITEEQGIDGPMITIEDAINRFTGGKGLRTGMATRCNGEEVNGDVALRDGDVVLITTEATAKGGYAGALALR